MRWYGFAYLFSALIPTPLIPTTPLDHTFLPDIVILPMCPVGTAAIGSSEVLHTTVVISAMLNCAACTTRSAVDAECDTQDVPLSRDSELTRRTYLTFHRTIVSGSNKESSGQQRARYFWMCSQDTR